MGDIIAGTLASMISLSVILLIAAQGESFVEKSGQFNLGIEGMMISSALCAFAATYFTGSTAAGIAAGAVTGAVLGLLNFLLIEGLKISGVLVGIVFNLLAGGVTGFLTQLSLNGGSTPLQSAKLEAVSIPLLSDIPYIGESLFHQNAVVYLAFLAVPLIQYYMFHTKHGLQIRAVGEDAAAARTMGINVGKVKRRCFILGGLTAGISGAYCSLTLGMFMDNMTANKGFIAMALCALCRQNPAAIFFGALFFALVDSIQIRLQLFQSGIPYEFMLCLPYIMTIIAVFLTSDKFRQKNRLHRAHALVRKTQIKKENKETEYYI